MLAAVSWLLNWTLPGPRTSFLFFPLWLGYVLVVDAWVLSRSGTSLLRRSRSAFAGVFAFSAPVWWLFEFVNLRTENWHYLGRASLTGICGTFLTCLNFSTVMPAIFETTELVLTFPMAQRLRKGPAIRLNRPILVGCFVGGLSMLALVMLWPRYFFPFVWLWGYLLLEPINVWRGYRSLGTYIQMGEWRPVIGLWIGALICGFFWEMWNYFSFPKWVYHVPFVGFVRVFEMPILGYGGYLPFAMELFAMYHLAVGFLWGGGLNRYVLASCDIPSIVIEQPS